MPFLCKVHTQKENKAEVELNVAVSSLCSSWLILRQCSVSFSTENIKRFSDVFRGHRKGTLTCNSPSSQAIKFVLTLYRFELMTAIFVFTNHTLKRFQQSFIQQNIADARTAFVIYVFHVSCGVSVYFAQVLTFPVVFFFKSKRRSPVFSNFDESHLMMCMGKKKKLYIKVLHVPVWQWSFLCLSFSLV